MSQKERNVHTEWYRSVVIGIAVRLATDIHSRANSHGGSDAREGKGVVVCDGTVRRERADLPVDLVETARVAALPLVPDTVEVGVVREEDGV